MASILNKFRSEFGRVKYNSQYAAIAEDHEHFSQLMVYEADDGILSKSKATKSSNSKNYCLAEYQHYKFPSLSSSIDDLSRTRVGELKRMDNLYIDRDSRDPSTITAISTDNLSLSDTLDSQDIPRLIEGKMCCFKLKAERQITKALRVACAKWQKLLTKLSLIQQRRSLASLS